MFYLQNKVQGTSINVFRNKHQKPKTSKYIPLEIKKKETLDVIQELQTVQKNIRFPKDVSKSEHFEEPPQRSSFKEPHIFNVKEKFKESMDLLAKGEFSMEQRSSENKQGKLFASGVLVMEFPCSERIPNLKF